MAVKMVSTGNILKMYLEENGFCALQLSEASNVSLRTIIRVLNDERPLDVEIALGMNKLLPGIKPEFLVSYDSKYQLQKKLVEKENGNVNISKVNSLYHMKKLYPDLANDELAMFTRAKEVFGLENINNNYCVNIEQLTVCFSMARGKTDNNHLIWLKAAYEDFRLSDAELLSFDRDAFLELFKKIKCKTFTSDIKTAIFNMRFFCKKVGINFYYRKSIPNARIKAAAVKDKKGYVYIFVSDLFKCVENLWLAFIHECLHIRDDDFSKTEDIKNNIFEEDVDVNYIDEEAIKYFIGDNYDASLLKTINGVVELAEINASSLSIVVEIARYKNKNYSNPDFNRYIHYYSSDEVFWSNKRDR